MIRKNWFEKAEPEIKPRATPSAFANWVFRASHGNLKKNDFDQSLTKQRLYLGKIDEKLIAQFKQFPWMQRLLGISNPKKSDWKPFFIDDGSSKKVFTASRLTVKGKPLKCRPDAVLYNEKENKFLIIERKTTRTPPEKIPEHGWPNVQAQLWCYSWIDEFLNAEEVLMVGQLWYCTSFKKGKTLRHEHPYWKRSDQKHHEECLKWFKYYGGEFLDTKNVQK